LKSTSSHTHTHTHTAAVARERRAHRQTAAQERTTLPTRAISRGSGVSGGRTHGRRGAGVESGLACVARRVAAGEGGGATQAAGVGGVEQICEAGETRMAGAAAAADCAAAGTYFQKYYDICICVCMYIHVYASGRRRRRIVLLQVNIHISRRTHKLTTPNDCIADF